MKVQKNLIFLFFMSTVIQIYGFGCGNKPDNLRETDAPPYTEKWFKKQIKRLTRTTIADEIQKTEFASRVLHNITFAGTMKRSEKQAAITEILCKGAQVDYYVANRKTPLFYSIIQNDLVTVQQLLTAQASLTLTQATPHNYIHLALAHGRPVLLHLLLNAKASVHETDHYAGLIDRCQGKDVCRLILPHIKSLNSSRGVHNALGKKVDALPISRLLMQHGAQPCRCPKLQCKTFFQEGLDLSQQWMLEADTTLEHTIPIPALRNIIKTYLFDEWHSKLLSGTFP